MEGRKGLVRPLAAAVLAIGLVSSFGAARVTSRSMEPALVPGDLALYHRGPSGVQEGDLVLYEKDGWPGGVVHRVTRVLPKGEVMTRGDANPIEDLSPVPKERIRGEVWLVVPFGGSVRSLARVLRRW